MAGSQNTANDGQPLDVMFEAIGMIMEIGLTLTASLAQTTHRQYTSTLPDTRYQRAGTDPTGGYWLPAEVVLRGGGRQFSQHGLFPPLHVCDGGRGTFREHLLVKRLLKGINYLK